MMNTEDLQLDLNIQAVTLAAKGQADTARLLDKAEKALYELENKNKRLREALEKMVAASSNFNIGLEEARKAADAALDAEKS
jgi:hypothetical protein